ncbi:hypothetical protein WJX84_007809 [Apatococcus fuscideae]|uniref:Tetratricopeptide repeat protein 30 n=1 Tax=Apatococcus fuscideae TaxID=2026836 RepID=A0AAW1RGI9_9CHLO
MSPLKQKPSDGQITSRVYGQIADGEYSEASLLLKDLLKRKANCPAGVSLLGFCSYQLGDYETAADSYAELVQLCPDNVQYRQDLAKAQLKAGQSEGAAGTAGTIPGSQAGIAHLQLCIKFSHDDISGCRQLLDSPTISPADACTAAGCLLYAEGNFIEAHQKFAEAAAISAFRPQLTYAMALCCYQEKQYGAALALAAEIIEHGVREHPELGIGSTAKGQTNVRRIPNSPTLQESALIETFNLKAAVELHMGNVGGAQAALQDMPPRAESELDPVTLHNLALAASEEDTAGCFSRLHHLLTSNCFPAEAFSNLLLLYCSPQHALYDAAADLMAQNPDLVENSVSKDMLQFLDACMLKQRLPDAAFEKFEQLSSKQLEGLHRLIKDLQVARLSRDEIAIRKAILAYGAALEIFIPVLMAQAHIYWEMEDFSQAEALLDQCSDVCQDHGVWRCNLAHAIFMQDGKTAEATELYAPLVEKAEASDGLLHVTAISIANLCAAYILDGQNDKAEAIMHSVEEEERHALLKDPEASSLHLCIINLVIGTLYCSRGLWDFGLSCIMKCLEPVERKLDMDTWFYTKRCLLGLLDNLSKRACSVKAETRVELAQFLQCLISTNGASQLDIHAGEPAVGSRSLWIHVISDAVFM